MSSRSDRSFVVVAGTALCLVAAAVLMASGAEPAASKRVLRVCADPNNLPFSNDRLEGFENRIAALVARDLGATVQYTWWAQRRGFIRNTLRAGACDVVMGLPSGIEMAATTRPYYRSTYAFVTRTGAGAPIRSFDDPRLRRLRVGVQIIGDDGANAPPAHALAARRIVSNVVGFPVYGDYSTPNPPRAIVDAVAEKRIDVAVAWGPLAGYFAAQASPPLRVTAAEPDRMQPFLPVAFSIGMGVRRSDRALHDELDTWIGAHRGEIARVLSSFHVPTLPIAPSTSPAPGGTP